MLILFAVNMAGCSQAEDKSMNAAKSWVSDGMVKWNHVIYITGNEEVIKVEKQIGSIKTSSINEPEETPDNFSNKFLSGTKLFSIPDIKVENAIAVQVRDGYYLKAQNVKIFLNQPDSD